MKKILCIYFILTCTASGAWADHITGGEIYYTLKSVSGNQYTYNVTVKMYMDCKSYREFYNPTYVSVFDKQTNLRVRDVLVPLTSIEVINLTENDDCITNPPQVCHRIGYYNFDLTLPALSGGYVLTTEVFFRVNNMDNLIPGYENIGATYTAEIPGTFILPTGPNNNSARFLDNDLVIICAGNEFKYSFAAEDKDGDKLAYSLCNAYRSDNFMFGIDLVPPAPPPYNSVPYGLEYSGGLPLGSKVTINEQTGLISGIAPSPGTYVITVCVEEWRTCVRSTVGTRDAQNSRRRNLRERISPLKTLGIASLALFCIVALAAPVAATSAGFVVTDPGTLGLLGAALVSVGVWTRRLFFTRRKGR